MKNKWPIKTILSSILVVFLLSISVRMVYVSSKIHSMCVDIFSLKEVGVGKKIQFLYYNGARRGSGNMSVAPAALYNPCRQFLTTAKIPLWDTRNWGGERSSEIERIVIRGMDTALVVGFYPDNIDNKTVHLYCYRGEGLVYSTYLDENESSSFLKKVRPIVRGTEGEAAGVIFESPSQAPGDTGRIKRPE